MLRNASAVAAVAALLLPATASAGARADARAISAGLTRAVAEGRLDRSEAYRYRLVVRRALRVLPRVPGARKTNLAGALASVAAQARRFTPPRAVTLFGMLKVNADHFSVRGMPLPGTDVRDADGVVHRAVWGSGLQFHPLGNAGELNSHVSERRDAAGARLASALAARAVTDGGALVWEYYVRFGGGRPPWTSGMAQAVAAQAFARAGTSYDDRGLLALAPRAYAAVPGLTMTLATGPWIRLYSFSGLVVLNAQLQTAESLANYAALTNDTDAAQVATRMRRSAAELLGDFDTRYWSRYALGGRESPLRYHLYVVRLLEQLGKRTGEAVWSNASTRFERYAREPPLVTSAGTAFTLYPRPADGHRDAARIVFWLSKISTVTVTTAGERRTYHLPGGWHSVTWRPGARPPGTYRSTLSAVDLAGNRATAVLASIEVRRDREPPAVQASVSARTLTWRAADDGTPWLRLRLRLARGDLRRVVLLGVRPLAGSLPLRLPRGTWNATLVAIDSSGNATRVPLGMVPAP